MGCKSCGGSKKSLNSTRGVTPAKASTTERPGKVTVVKATNSQGGVRTILRNGR